MPNSTYITANTGGTVVWQEGEAFGGFNLLGGTINLQQGSATSSGTTAQSFASGTLTGTGTGSFTVAGAAAINKTTSGTVTVTGNASIATTTGGLNIQEGTLAMVNAGNLGTSNIALGNTAGTTAGTFEYQGATAARAGTFAVNAGGGTIAVTNSVSTLTLSGAITGAGNLAKTGNGSLHLTGALGTTGTTSVAAGTLRVNPVTASGAFAASGTGALAINAGSGAASFTTTALSLNGSASSLRFELNTASLPTAPLVIVSNVDGLTPGGGAISVQNLQAFAAGTYTLMDYSGAGISSRFTLSALPGRTAGSLVYNTANTLIDLNITGSDSIKWSGAVNGNWDVGTAVNVGGTQNWRLNSSNAATNFIQSDSVTFDDTATGNTTVNIAGAVQPASVIVTGANDYTFQGSGFIDGSTGLVKSGAGKLTIATANAFSGATTLSGGTIQIGAGGTVGSLGTSTVTLAAGTLTFNRSDATTLSNSILLTGNASLENAGAGTVTLASTLAVGTNTKALRQPAAEPSRSTPAAAPSGSRPPRRRSRSPEPSAAPDC